MDGKQKTAFREKAFQEVFEKANLEDLGFKSKKGIFTRTTGEFIDTISYGSSSRANSLKETNEMIVRASTEHKSFKQFQNEVLGLTYLNGAIGGEHLENLFNGPPYVSYDIGISEDQKEIAVTNMIAAIQAQVLPFFELCRDQNQIAAMSHIPAFLPERLFEYCIFLGKKDLITVILENLISKAPELKVHLGTFLDNIKKEGLEKVESEKTWPDHTKTRAKNLAIRLKQLDVVDYCAAI